MYTFSLVSDFYFFNNLQLASLFSRNNHFCTGKDIDIQELVQPFCQAKNSNRIKRGLKDFLMLKDFFLSCFVLFFFCFAFCCVFCLSLFLFSSIFFSFFFQILILGYCRFYKYKKKTRRISLSRKIGVQRTTYFPEFEFNIYK